MSEHLRPDMSGAHTPAPLRPCDVFSEEIHLLVDRELGPAETQVVEEHLAVCSRCQALAAHLERMSGVLKAWDAQANDVATPALRMKHSVLARVAEQGAQRRREDRLIRVMHYATAALVVLGLGLGVVLGFAAQDVPAQDAPAAALGDAPMPLERRDGGVTLASGGPVEPYAPEDMLAGVRRPSFHVLESPASAGGWERALWAPRAADGLPDGLPLLVERFLRLEALERRLGEPVMVWNGPAADKGPATDLGDERLEPMVTVSALAFLRERGYLQRWKQHTTKTSPSVVAAATPLAASLDTGVHANAMLRPLPGIDRDLRALHMRAPMMRTFYTPQPAPVPGASSAGASSKGARKQERVHLLDGWALPRERRSARGLESGPIGAARVDPARVRFLDPVAANANGQLQFADAGQDANTVVAIVKGTDEPIYIPAGQFLTGGIADRVIANPVWLPASRGEKPFLVHCRVVQNFEHGDAGAALSLQPEIAGPTVRALLAAGASPRQVKQAVGRLMAAVYRQKGALLGDWSLYTLYRGRYAREAGTQAMSNIGWDALQGFVVVDAQGRFLGSEIVRPGGLAASELLRRLWVSYSMEAAQRAFAARSDAFAAPSDALAQVLERLAGHPGTFRTPRGVEQPVGARVSHLDVVAAGVCLHALEVAGSPAIVSALSSAP